MNFKIPNVCAKRAEKNQCLVYFEQISLPKIKKNVKTQVSWKKLKLFLKKLKLFGFKTQRTGSESLHPATIKVVKKRAWPKGIWSRWNPITFMRKDPPLYGMGPIVCQVWSSGLDAKWWQAQKEIIAIQMRRCDHFCRQHLVPWVTTILTLNRVNILLHLHS